MIPRLWREAVADCLSQVGNGTTNDYLVPCAQFRMGAVLFVELVARALERAFQKTAARVGVVHVFSAKIAPTFDIQSRDWIGGSGEILLINQGRDLDRPIG